MLSAISVDWKTVSSGNEFIERKNRQTLIGSFQSLRDVFFQACETSNNFFLYISAAQNSGELTFVARRPSWSENIVSQPEPQVVMHGNEFRRSKRKVFGPSGLDIAAMR